MTQPLPWQQPLLTVRVRFQGTGQAQRRLIKNLGTGKAFSAALSSQLVLLQTEGVAYKDYTILISTTLSQQAT